MLRLAPVKTILIAVLSVTISNSVIACGDADRQLEASIGKLVLKADELERYDYSDSNPFGMGKIFSMAQLEFETVVSKMSADQKINYLWSLLFRFDFQGGDLHELQLMIASCCKKEFIEKLDRFIALELKNKKRETTKIRYAKAISKGLRDDFNGHTP
mgnify:CR=1 FL=1